MKIKVLKSKEEILLLKEDWEALFDKGNYSVFQSFTYCYNSLVKQSKPLIIYYYENRKLVEIKTQCFVGHRLVVDGNATIMVPSRGDILP